jgi:hypothetical protein
MVFPPRGQVNEPMRGVGGWLAVLCLLLLVWHPLNLALRAARALAAISQRGAPLALLIVAQLIVAGVGVAAGLSLSNQRRGAVGLAKSALLLAAGVDLLVYATPWMPNNRLPGTTPLYAAAALTYYGIWIAYLSRSRRVRATFPSDL